MFIPRKTYEAIVAENESMKTANGKLTRENIDMYQKYHKKDQLRISGKFTKK